MANWVLKGLRTGIRTTAYPERHRERSGVSPGRPLGALVWLSDADAESLVAALPDGARLRDSDGGVAIDHGRCVHCFRCQRDDETSVSLGSRATNGPPMPTRSRPRSKSSTSIFGRSLHIRFVDAGACGACMSEARQLNNPYYNMHRLGFFITPTPRNADILLVAGPVSDAMRLPLRKTYEAMPTPKRVVAIGACAISGGVFGPSFAASGGVAEIIPVDVVVPGCPPPPLAILHGLLVVVERKPPSALVILAARAVRGAGMSAAAQLSCGILHPLRSGSRRRVSGSAAMEPGRAGGNRIAGCADRSAGKRSAADRRISPSKPTYGQCSRLGTLTLGGGSALRIFSFRHRSRVPAGIDLLRHLSRSNTLRALQLALFQPALSRAVRFDRAGAHRRMTRSRSSSHGS